jgi:hypothetical protein
MGTVSAMILSVVLAADGEPLSADELKVAVAALEESRSRLQSFEVKYRMRQEVAPDVESRGAEAPSGEFKCEWHWRMGQAHFLRVGPNSRKEWWYDGEKSYSWVFKRGDAPKLDRVLIYHWRAEQAVNYDLALVSGFGGPFFDGGVAALANNALRSDALSGKMVNQQWELALGKHDVNRVDYDVTLVLDPQHDFRLVFWEIANRDHSVPDIHRYIIDEFQSAVDEADGSAIWYPLRAHIVQPIHITWLEVGRPSINLNLPDSRFTPPEMPFGTRVEEYLNPGESPKVYLVGGEDAEEQRLAALVAIARKEQERVELEGVAFDATQPSGSKPLFWIGIGGILLLCGGVLHWRRRRAA